MTETANDMRTDHLTDDQRLIAEAVLRVAGHHADGGGCRAFYRPDEWVARGEKFGRDSALVVCHDGGDLEDWFNWDFRHYDKIERMEEELHAIGYYAEQCTFWYSAIYRRPTQTQGETHA